MLEGWGAVVFAITPTLLVGLIFWYVLRSIIRADRKERETYARIEAEERARIAPQGSTSGHM